MGVEGFYTMVAKQSRQMGIRNQISTGVLGELATLHPVDKKG